MMDLNPINTPKSVLTDCVNGTFITYNGNEFVLQNDMGNYELKNCKLPTNFIPVGVKGYADILYIVSYNPLTKEVEIGSYPAPQSIFSTGTSPDVGPDNQLTYFIINETWQYNNIIQEQKKNLYVFMDGTDQDIYKMYPGDEFKITGLTQEDLDFPYQHLNFYIIDEDNKLFDIDDTEIYANVSEDYKKVFWETPGWLAAQYDLYVPDKFNLNLRSLNVPEFITDNKNTSIQSELPQPDADHFEVSMNLSAQVIISDSLFQDELMKDGHVNKVSQQFEHLKVRFKFSCESGNFAYLTEDPVQTYTGSNQTIDINCHYHNYQDDIITAYVNCTPVWFMNNPTNPEDLSDYNGIISVEAYPIIDMGAGKVLEYTQFTTTYKFQLNNLKNKSAINIGENIYKWSVDDDSCTISFDVNGPFVNANNITGRYEIYRVNLFNEELKTPVWDLNNPISYSSFNLVSNLSEIQTDVQGYWDSNSKTFKELKTIDENNFYSDKNNQLLMCKGDISNLVLYGQNTLNIEWASSNKYILSNFTNTYTNPEYDQNDETSEQFITTASINKKISFEKEGGIYLLRIILEQNHEFISDTVLPLVPSEVFNEWFGEKDNYLDENNGVTTSMWISKWLNYIDVSLNLNYIQANILDKFKNENIDDIEVLAEYKLRSETEYKSLIITNKTTIIDLLPKPDITNYKYQTDPSDTLQIRIPYKELVRIDSDINLIINGLFGNLWNNIYSYKLQLESNDQTKFIYQHNTFDLNNIYISWDISLNGTYNSSYTLEGSENLFEKMFENDAPTIEFNFSNPANTGGNAGAKHPRKNYQCYYQYGNTSLGTENLPYDKNDILGLFQTENNKLNVTECRTENDFFLESGFKAIETLNSSFVWIKLDVSGYDDNSTLFTANYEKIFNRAPVGEWNPVTAIKKAKSGWANGYGLKKLLGMRAANLAGNKKALVVLFSRNTDFDDETLESDLKKLKFSFYNSQKSVGYYITSFNKTDTINTLFTLNKFTFDLNLQYLRTDDYLWDSSNNKFSELILSTIGLSFQNNKNIHKNLLNNVVFNYNFLNIPIIYQFDTTGINTEITTFITKSKEEIVRSETITNPGIYIEYGEPNDVCTNAIVNRLKEGILSAEPIGTIGLNSLYFNNEISEMISGVNTSDIDSGDRVDNSGYVMYSYIQDL